MRFSGSPSGGPFRVRVRRGAGRAAPVRRVFLAGAAARGGFFPPERRKFAIGERFWGFAARDGGFGGKSRGRATSQGRGEARNAVEGGKTVRQAHVFADKRRSLCVKPPLTEAGPIRCTRSRPSGEGFSKAPAGFAQRADLTYVNPGFTWIWPPPHAAGGGAQGVERHVADKARAEVAAGRPASPSRRT